jgi:hypothetical protein
VRVLKLRLLTFVCPISAIPRESFLFIPPDKVEHNMFCLSSRFNFCKRSLASILASRFEQPFNCNTNKLVYNSKVEVLTKKLLKA